MQLQNILNHIQTLSIHGNADKIISSVSQDSREIQAGGLFVAVAGSAAEGYAFIDDAIGKGATVVVSEMLPVKLHKEVTYIVVTDARATLADIADVFYDFPSKKLQLIGVTGTNGKTTTATLLYQTLTHAGYKCGLLSTIENRIHDQIIPATRTTPDPITLRKLLVAMIKAGCLYCVMEVSSHALHQKRVHGLMFAAGIFTNLTQDHLDYHHTMENYLHEKKKFFDMLPESAFAIINADDAAAQKMITDTKAKRIFFSLQDVSIIKSDITESLISYNNEEYVIPLPGKYNIANGLGVILSLRSLGLQKDEIQNGLRQVQSPRGRFQVLRHPSEVVGIVDYAHTPDGVKNVLQAIKAVKNKESKLITVIGCGGNRDVTKRPKMLDAALEYSDMVIGTTDNPRSEDPVAILDDMEQAVTFLNKQKYLRVIDRKEAILKAISIAGKGDIVAILGKGHEEYQEIEGVFHHFSDTSVFMGVDN